jgi:ferritin-like metal-binding protein YciE
MEVHARQQMERQAHRLNDYPEVQDRVIRHLEETKLQLQRLEQCLEGCGESPSREAASAWLPREAQQHSIFAANECLSDATFQDRASTPAAALSPDCLSRASQFA